MPRISSVPFFRRRFKLERDAFIYYSMLHDSGRCVNYCVSESDLFGDWPRYVCYDRDGRVVCELLFQKFTYKKKNNVICQ